MCRVVTRRRGVPVRPAVPARLSRRHLGVPPAPSPPSYLHLGELRGGAADGGAQVRAVGVGRHPGLHPWEKRALFIYAIASPDWHPNFSADLACRTRTAQNRRVGDASRPRTGPFTLRLHNPLGRFVPLPRIFFPAGTVQIWSEQLNRSRTVKWRRGVLRTPLNQGRVLESRPTTHNA